MTDLTQALAPTSPRARLIPQDDPLLQLPQGDGPFNIDVKIDTDMLAVLSTPDGSSDNGVAWHFVKNPATFIFRFVNTEAGSITRLSPTANTTGLSFSVPVRVDDHFQSQCTLPPSTNTYRFNVHFIPTSTGITPTTLPDTELLAIADPQIVVTPQ